MSHFEISVKEIKELHSEKTPYIFLILDKSQFDKSGNDFRVWQAANKELVSVILDSSISDILGKDNNSGQFLNILLIFVILLIPFNLISISIESSFLCTLFTISRNGFNSCSFPLYIILQIFLLLLTNSPNIFILL